MPQFSEQITNVVQIAAVIHKDRDVEVGEARDDFLSRPCLGCENQVGLQIHDAFEIGIHVRTDDGVSARPAEENCTARCGPPADFPH